MGCSASNVRSDQKTCLFAQLGGDEALIAAVDKFYTKMEADPSVRDFFRASDMQLQRRHQKNFLTYNLGGPNNYTGRTMKDIHRNMGVTDAHFDTAKHHLKESLLELKVSQDLCNKTLAVVETLRADICNK